MASPADYDPYTTPAMKPPNGQLPNFGNSETMHVWLVATAVICLTVSLLSILLRTFVKVALIRRVEVEDYALVFSGAAFVAFVGVAIGRNGLSRHLWELTIAQALHVLLFEDILGILYCFVMFPAKLCVLLQMQRIFRGNKRDSVFWSIQVLIWSNLLFYLAILGAFIGICSPRAKLTNPLLPGTCISINATIIASSAINIISDVTILFLPVFAVWKLQLAIKRKLIISGVFGSGVFACISSVLRLVYTIRFSRATDSTWAMNPVCMWIFAEFTTVILASTIPTLPRLYQALSHRHPSPQCNGFEASGVSHRRQRGFRASKYVSLAWRDSSRAEMGVRAIRAGTRRNSRNYAPLSEQPPKQVPQAAVRGD